jgi:formate dehydrogenase major subunit/NADH-quinone oxidoreductase subunit G
MKTVTLTIDDKTVQAREGDILLWVALDNGIYIPNLCALREREQPFAGCRLCFVEIAGYPEPVTSCTEPVKDGMVVLTQTEKVRCLQRTAFDLIMSTHHVDCGHCKKNKNCELQKIARHLKAKLKPKRLRPIPKNLPVDDSHSRFIYYPNKCVLCGRCVWTCREKQNVGALNFAYRGFDMTVTTFGQLPFQEEHCTQCTDCVNVCPVGALLLKESQEAPVQ